MLRYCQENRLFKQGDKVLLAVSGGADSMCLADLFIHMARQYDLKLYVAHVEHGIRGEESLADMELVRSFCQRNGLPFYVYRTRIPELAAVKKTGVEQTAREERKRFFSVLCAEHGIDCVATAHQATDNAETVLLHLTRGASLNGIKGMTARNGKNIRPLLCVTAREVRSYCAEYGVEYRVDKTNDDVNYSRNLIRKEVLPLLERINPNLVETIRINSEQLQEQDAVLQRAAQRVFDENAVSDNGEIRLVLPDGEFPLDRVIVLMAQALGVTHDLYSSHIKAVKELIGKTGKRVSLSHGLCARFSYGELILFFENEETKDETETVLTDTGVYCAAGGMLIVEDAGLEKEKGVHYADKEKLFDCRLTLRTRRDGDRFKPYASGTKKLKEYLIDKKIPREDRDGLVLLADGDEILYVGGVEISDKICVDENTKNTVVLRYLPKTEGRL